MVLYKKKFKHPLSTVHLHLPPPPKYITKVLHQDVNITFRTAAKLANALKMDFFPALKPKEEGGSGAENCDAS